MASLCRCAAHPEADLLPGDLKKYSKLPMALNSEHVGIQKDLERRGEGESAYEGFVEHLNGSVAAVAFGSNRRKKRRPKEGRA